MKKLLNRIVPSALLFLIGSTLTVSAQSTTGVQAGFKTLEGLINSFSQTVVVAFGSLLMAGAVVIFFMGIVQYIWGLRSGDAGKAKVGSNFMLWGLVGLFVMFSVYGIVRFGQEIFFGKGADITTITIPKIKFDNTGGSTPGGNDPLGGGACSNNPCTTNGGPCTCSNGAAGTCRNSVCSR